MLPRIDPKVFKFTKTDGEHRLVIIPPELLDEYWPSVQAELEKEPELWNKAHTVESLYEHIMNSQIKLWAVYDLDYNVKMWFFTTFTVYPVLKVLTLVWASGRNLNKYLSMGLSALDSYASETGCNGIILDGRKGWGPLLTPFGYSELQVSFFKRLPNTRIN